MVGYLANVACELADPAAPAGAGPPAARPRGERRGPGPVRDPRRLDAEPDDRVAVHAPLHGARPAARPRPGDRRPRGRRGVRAPAGRSPLFVRPIAVAVLPVALARALRAPARAGGARCSSPPSSWRRWGWAWRRGRPGTTSASARVVVLTTNLGAHNAPFFGIDRARIVEERPPARPERGRDQRRAAGRDRPGGGPVARVGGGALRAARARPLLARAALGGPRPPGDPHVRVARRVAGRRTACTAPCSSSTT